MDARRHPVRVLAEAVRIAERALDQQVASLLTERTELERLMRLGIAAVAGTLAAAGLLVQVAAPMDGAVIALLGSGLVLQSWATAAASRTGTLDVSSAPDLDQVYQQVGEGWSIDQLHAAVLELSAMSQIYHRDELKASARRRRTIHRRLFLGAGLVLAGVAYIVGGAMFA